MDGHPVTLVLDDDLRRSRVTVLFRLPLAIPHLIWAGLWTLAAAVAAVATWLATLATGRPPAALHRFLSLYVRYVTQLGGYLVLAANPYPGFVGDPGYPVDVELPEPARQGRLGVLFRLPLALPALLLAVALGAGVSGGGSGGWDSGGGEGGGALLWGGGLAAVCAFLGWFASLARGRMPSGLRDLAAYGVGYTAQAYAYALLLTDRYPDADPDAIGPAWRVPPHPVSVVVEDDGRRSRLTVLFRLLLALPHVVWLVLWTVAAWAAAILNGLAALVTGRAPEPCYRFVAAYVRYATHVGAYAFLVANPFPGFVGAPGYPVDVTIGPRERQRRPVTLFRFFLAIPALLVGGGLLGALAVAGLLGWFAALATGRMPAGLRNLGAVALRYAAQTNAYWFVITDAYPYASPRLHPTEPETNAEAEPSSEPVEHPVH